MSNYRKTLTALVTGGIGWATMVVQSAPPGITATEWIAAATVGATALGVYAIANDPA
jgi:hypothetical protein